MSVAGVAHPVERHLAKVEVASSSLVTRSIKRKADASASAFSFYFAVMTARRIKSNLPGAGWRRRLDGAEPGNHILNFRILLY